MVKATPLLSLRAAVCLLLLASLAGPAGAQNVQPGVTLVLDETLLSLGANNTTEVGGTVTNTGALAGSVALTLTIPDGWTVTVDPPSAFNLPAGQSATITLTLVAPAAGAGTQNGTLGVDALLTEANTGRTAGASASLGVTRVDPPVPPPPPPPYGLYATLAGSAAALVALGIVLWARARSKRLAAERAAAEEARRKAEHEAYLARETGIAISLVEGPQKFGNRRELVFRVAVQNQTPRERVALIGVAQLPEGWTAASAIPKMPLGPGERAVVTFYANPADDVPAGAKASLAFFAKPEEAKELDERVTVEVTAPEPRVPENGDRPVTAPREAVAPRPWLRR